MVYEDEHGLTDAGFLAQTLGLLGDDETEETE